MQKHCLVLAEVGLSPVDLPITTSDSTSQTLSFKLVIFPPQFT